MRRLALATALLLAPALASAQADHLPITPVAFTGATQTYTVYGCGDGPISGAAGAPSMRLFCLDGTATVGVARYANGSAFMQTVLDLTGTRLNGFTRPFEPANFTGIDVPSLFQFVDGHTEPGHEYFYTAIDLTGRTTAAYSLAFPVEGTPDYLTLTPLGAAFGTSGTARLAYFPADVPLPAIINARALVFSLAVTAVPEPSTLALTVGGLAVLGANAWRRRRT